MTLVAILLTGLTVVLLTTNLYAVAWLPAGGAAALVLLSRKPAIGFYVLAFTFPFSLVREIGGIKIHWVISAGLMLLMAIRLYSDREAITRLSSRLWVPLVLFLLANVIASLYSPYPATAWGTVTDLVMAYVFFAITVFFIDTEQRLETLSWVVVGSIAVSSLFAVLEVFFGIVLPVGEVNTDTIVQGSGLTGTHNSLSFLIAGTIPLAFHNAVHARSGLGRFVAAGFLLLLLLGMLATYSRGGFLLTMMALFLIGLQHIRSISKLHVGLFLLMMVSAPGVLYLTAPDDYIQHQLALIGADSKGMDDTRRIDRRFAYLDVASQAFVESPIIGHGPNAFRDIFADADEERWFERDNESSRRYAHNTYVDVAVGSGLVGLAGFLAVLGTTLFGYSSAMRMAAEAGRTRLQRLIGSYRLSLFLLMVYMLIKSALDNKNVWLLIAASAIAMNVVSKLQRNHAGEPHADD